MVKTVNVMCILLRKHRKGELPQDPRRGPAAAGPAPQSELRANDASTEMNERLLRSLAPALLPALELPVLTLSANTTLKRIIVGASLFGDGSVFETWKRNTI